MLTTNHLLSQLPTSLSLIAVAAATLVRGAVAIIRVVMHNLNWRQAISKAEARDLPAITANMAASWGAVREGNATRLWRAIRAARASPPNLDLPATAVEISGTDLVHRFAHREDEPAGSGSAQLYRAAQ